MSTDPLREPPTPKRVTRSLPHTMDHDLRGVVGTRHIATVQTMRQVKDEKKEVVGTYTSRLESLDLEAKSLELASGAKDGEEVRLSTPCLESAVLHEGAWQMKLERIERDPSTGQEYRVFVSYEQLPEEFDYLNQGNLFDPKPPPGGGGGSGGSDSNDKLKDVDFPEEDEEESSGGERDDEPPPKPVQPGEKTPKKPGRGKKK
jgi:hypothetical protein